jgi:cell division protein FtsI/penicillin-binding protein 2
VTRFLIAAFLLGPVLSSLLSSAPGADQDANYILIDIRSREVRAARWPDADVPIPVGSLVKPFTALAFPGPFPEFECRGAANGCWRAKPHGELSIVDALAQSCNAYFLQLAARVDADALAVVAATFGIPPPRSNTTEARIGLGDEWRISPLALTRAYAELALRAGDPRADQLLAGLERAARSGTAQGISREGERVLAKTGTAPCVAPRPHKGDGFAIVLYPAEAPRTALLVRVHNVPGAEAAKTAAKLLRGLREGR